MTSKPLMLGGEPLIKLTPCNTDILRKIKTAFPTNPRHAQLQLQLTQVTITSISW